MDRFWEEIETGEIHFRDKWQFELKSEFFPLPNQTSSSYTQEFYIFLPTSLLINEQTYSKTDFYQAQTSLIRFKTPEIPLKELLNLKNSDSPLTNLRSNLTRYNDEKSLENVTRELKLYANIFRSSLRREIYPILLRLEAAGSDKECLKCKLSIEELFSCVNSILEMFKEIKDSYSKAPQWQSIRYVFDYVEDVASIAINSSATGLLKVVRSKHLPGLQSLDDLITKLLLKEKLIREENLKEPSHLDKNSALNETILYQNGLLNKFVMDALQLKTARKAIDDTFRSIMGGFAAGITMLLYLTLFIWQGSIFVINSLPFVIFSVFIYVVKDRLKDELKTLSVRQLFRWFPDFTTKILSPSGKSEVGKMHDSFGFIKEKQVPSDIWKQYDGGYHAFLDMIKLPEKIMYFKKQIIVHSDPKTKSRLGALNVIFRYDIHKIMAKASDPYEPYTTIDKETLDLITTELPKVYHINILMKNSYLGHDLKPHVELKEFRLIADKEGIKRIESLS